MDKSPNKLFYFGEFCLDTEEKLLKQGEKIVSLPPKVLDVLCLLVEREGKIVSKNEIMDTVWADSFVEESNLTQSIYTLRRTLGTDLVGNNIIETVPRRGFRIAIPISQESFAEQKTEILQVSEEKQLSFFQQNKFILGIFAASLLLISVAFFLYKIFIGNKQTLAPIENVTFQKLTTSGDIASPTISPDGKSIIYVKQGNLFLQDINTGSNVQLNVVNHNVFGNLQFSLDGETLYFRNERRTDAGGDIFQVSRFGGAARKILENSWSGIGLSPNGKNIAFVRYFPKEAKWILFRKNLETGEEKSLFERNSPDSIYRTGFPAWSPDGTRILTVAQEKPASTIYVIDAETGRNEKQNTTRFVQIEQTLWTNKGNGILIVGREKDRFFQLWRMSYPQGEIQRITNDLSIYRHISLSADGKNLLAENQTIFSHIWVAAADNLENQTQITSGNIKRDGNAGLAWVNDDNLIFASRITGDVDIWSVRLSDNSTQQLTKNAGSNNENPNVSKNGEFVYFESNRTGSRHIWRMKTNGDNPTQMTFSEKESEFYPLLSPDEKWLYYLQKTPKGNVISRKSLTEEKIETVIEQGNFSPDSFLSLSPDGKMLAFNNIKEKKSDEVDAKTSEIGIVYLEEQNRVKTFIVPRIGVFVWASDGKSFDYNENTIEGGKIWRKTLDDQSEPKLLLTLPKTTIYNFVWSNEGKKIAIARGKQERDAILLKNFE